ncbi:ribonuclease III [bacterium]|nr:ribonuclease III [bacterium]
MNNKIDNLTSLEEILGVHFKNKNLIRTALTHRSYLNEHPNVPQEHNERLEFLGDAVLEFLVTDYLYKSFKNKPEGELTALRAALVNSQRLAEVARTLKIENYLLLSKGEEKDKGRARISILENTMEAIIGAIYLDQGIERAKEFVKNNILVHLPEILQKGEIRDPKSQFQELAQERFAITPTYSTLKEWGPDHRREFLVGVYLGKKLIAKGHGFSKQEAEEEAAREALKNL